MSTPVTYLYAIQNDDSGLIKIGRSDSPEARRLELRGEHRAPMTLIAFRASDAWGERCAHNELLDSREFGEWFRPTHAVMDFVRRMRKEQPENRSICVPEGEWLSVTQAAHALGVSRQSVYNWVATGRLGADHVAGRLVIRNDSLGEAVRAKSPVQQ